MGSSVLQQVKLTIQEAQAHRSEAVSPLHPSQLRPVHSSQPEQSPVSFLPLDPGPALATANSLGRTELLTLTRKGWWWVPDWVLTSSVPISMVTCVECDLNLSAWPHSPSNQPQPASGAFCVLSDSRPSQLPQGLNLKGTAMFCYSNNLDV